ncbi:unnamed protein product [Allacma fusca]|uniref:Uncharacterized protein n=1 Tax=Allacma fusca TaxID=39272 RepID=A0A8J2L8D5_9HEXA|nr:unnamed protein product [Allacma fusca]
MSTEAGKGFRGDIRHTDSVEGKGSPPGNSVPDMRQLQQQPPPHDMKMLADAASHLARPREQDLTRVPGTG